MTSNSGAIRQIKKGEYILRQGEAGELAYIVESGQIEMIIELSDGTKKHVIEGAGCLFGELALLANTKRAASAVALEDTTLICITRADFTRRIDSADPILKLITQNLVRYCQTLLDRNSDEYLNLFEGLEIDSVSPDTKRIEEAPQESRQPAEIAHSSELVSTMRMEHALSHAIDNNELELYYQPIINLTTLETSGFEALMRWNHPADGMISPNIFIPLAEDTGLIEQLSEWALREATQALSRFEKLSGAPDNLYISVNFSSHDLSKPEFLTELNKAVQSTQLSPGQIKIEITERLLIMQPEVAAKTLQDCRDAGFSIAIDDFGTGYSSLSYLQDFPIDTLKIDRAFVKKMVADSTSEELVRTIVHLGKTLGMDIIAEGAETIEEVQKLIALNCDMVQGYYFSPPMEESKVTECFHKWTISE
jgi:EAL domain-containing protein (putative c-di-GMP-specific phosphodiesterase class I)/CRP-like cAMP-binding protein